MSGGIFLPIQVAVNTLLRKHIGAPMQVTFISFLVGTVASLFICIAARYPLPTAAGISATSWWMWFGGLLGTFYVWATIFATPHIGAALAMALTVAGQMSTALLLDHYGAFGLQRYPLSFIRITGIVLVIAGVSLIAYTKK
ncbi:MAG: DMT family transporter [Desulfamplus sp.]|nr:DMT family transporter [Desulfamplus sp.]MBF0411711.1 DMT family transporter [Desulfamplus sp.]